LLYTTALIVEDRFTYCDSARLHSTCTDRPHVWLIVLNAVSILLVSIIALTWMYLGANVPQSVTNLSSVIYQIRLAASLDRSGRVVAVSAGLVTLGNGLGPGLSAGLSRAFSAPFVGVFVLVLNGVALGLYGAVKLRSTEGPPMPASLTRSFASIHPSPI
jgi:hypothetical protein